MPQISSSKPLRLGTRGSRLALAQAAIVRAALKSAAGADCEIVVVKTTGDRIQDRPLAEAGGKGLFVKELEEALLSDQIDLAVHSMKDMPPAVPDRLGIAACLPREDPRDAFLSRRGSSLKELPKGARIGTSSVRRHAQVARARPDLSIIALRGNVDTRIAKLERGEYDAMLLALAGLKRLGLESKITALMPAEAWLPALAQGAIGIEIRNDDRTAADAMGGIDHMPTSIAIACERAFANALGGSCNTPVGGLATLHDDVLRFSAEVLAPDGKDFVDTRFEETLRADAKVHAAELGRKAGEAIRPRVEHWLVL